MWRTWTPCRLIGSVAGADRLGAVAAQGLEGTAVGPYQRREVSARQLLRARATASAGVTITMPTFDFRSARLRIMSSSSRVTKASRLAM